MQIDGNDIQMNEKSLNKTARKVIDFKQLLDEFGLSYVVKEFYLQVGEIQQVQGWILHLSAVSVEIERLLRLVIPALVMRDIPFKIIRDSETAKYILDADLGYYRLGKIVALYPREEVDILELASWLIQLTKGFRGPAIPTDKHLGSIVYTRYGSYNPILKAGVPGNIRYIYDGEMNLIPDEFVIPYMPPAKLKWPFSSLVSGAPIDKGKLLKKTYKQLSVMKDDSKGRVLKGIYMKGIFSPRYCVIKEGKKDMWLDEFGRDIQDRLRWQYDLCRDLAAEIPFPQIFDLFEEGGDLYLVMEFIHGQSLEATIYSLYQQRCWVDLAIKEKEIIFKYLITIARVIAAFHERGYVHRDITPANFLIDKKDRVFLIDMELSYSINRSFPHPPFKFGTLGYVSPEQKRFKIPDIRQDVYAVGALMLFMLTGLPPTKFNVKVPAQLVETIFFFVRNQEMTALIAQCLSIDPLQRPLLNEVIAAVTACQQKVGKGKGDESFIYPDSLDRAEVRKITQLALNGIAVKELLTEDFLWDSPVLFWENGRNGYAERRYLPDFYNGMSGILYCIAKAKMLEYQVDDLMPAFDKSVSFVKNAAADGPVKQSPGLYYGTAGIALALAQGLEARMILEEDASPLFMKGLFLTSAGSLDYANGIAGQGMALINCRRWIPQDFTVSTLKYYVRMIVDRQLKDGSWSTGANGKGNKRDLGFVNGIPGIISFLIAYINIYKDSEAEQSVRKGLKWLERVSTIKKGVVYWDTGDKSATYFLSRDYGLPGIISVFIKAYQFFRDESYRVMAEGALRFLSPFPVHADFTQANGLAGLGEMYLEAFKVFANEECKNRADWIANVFSGFVLNDRRGNIHWLMDYGTSPVVSLMTGSCGGIHFFLSYSNPAMSNIIYSSLM